MIASAAAAALCLAAGSCSSSGCLENRTAIPRAAFLTSPGGREMKLDSLQITGVGAPGDSALVSPGTAISEVYLPMRSTAESTSWCFAYKYADLDYDDLNDTITFTYESIPYFASEECGAAYRYRLTGLRHTANLIDSIAVTDSLITNFDKVYLNIYFRTGGEAEGQ